MPGPWSARRNRFRFSSVRYHKLCKELDSTMKSTTDPAEESSSSSSLETENLKLKTDFSFRSYQREDLARSAVHDGAIIAWDPGLGKTMAIFAWPFIKRANRVLIVAPASLHAQIIAEGETKFRTTVTPIPDQAAAYTLMRSGHLPMAGQLPLSSQPPHHACTSPMTSEPMTNDSAAMPRFFITDYRWLGYNGGDEWAAGAGDDDDFAVTDVVRRRRMAVIARYFNLPQTAVTAAENALTRLARTCKAHELLGVPADAPRSAVKAAYRELARLTHPDLHPDDPTATARMQRLNQAIESMLKGHAEEIIKGLDTEIATAVPTIAALMAGIGTTRCYPATSSLQTENLKLETSHTVKCVFTPTLSTLLADCFDCVVADEAVRLKSGTTYIAAGVLGLRPRYRLALTGTPIKNRLPDIFFLASWVCGSSPTATARWPYGNTTAARSSFANNHLVMEENETKTAKSRKAGNFKRYIKQTNRITNVHLLWKLLGPVVARRRKDQVGNDIVGKIIHPIRVLPGTAQQSVYKWHLENPPECATPIAAMGAQLQCLRQAALCPWSSSLGRPGITGARSASPWSPKMLAILHLAADLMEKGEQLVVFSPFQEFSTTLRAALTDARVPALMLDGRTKNTKRGTLAAEFKTGKYPVLIAGIEAMGEGHSFECASHLVIPSLAWAYDSNRQSMDRVHRLTSKKDVTIYLMITTNSIDERLAAIFQEKGDASDLALDGRLFDEDKEEVTLADLIRSASLSFDPTATTIPESSVHAEWEHSLMKRLASAASTFTLTRGTAPAARNPQQATPNPQPATPDSQSIAAFRTELADLYALMTSSPMPPSSAPTAEPRPSERSDTSTAPSSSSLETENLKLETSNIIPFPPQRPRKPTPQSARLADLLTF